MIINFKTPISDQSTLEKFLKSLDQEIHNREVKYGECLWDTYLGKAKDDLNVLEGRISDLLLDPDHLEVIRTWRGKVDDPILERILDLFERVLLASQVLSHPDVFRLKNEINQDIISFQPVIDGKTIERSDLRDIMHYEKDRSIRQKGYFAEKPLHDKTVERCVNLIKMRNDRARDLGYSDFMNLGLPMSDIHLDEILLVFDRLEAGTRDLYYGVLNEASSKAGYDRLEPWDVGFLIQKTVSLPREKFPKDRMVDWTKEMAVSLGFPQQEFKDIHIEFGDIPFGGVCFGIDSPKDIRVLLNPRDGLNYVKVLFHEFGHALHDRYVPEGFHIAKSDTGAPFGEGMAEFLEGIAEEKEWLTSHTDFSEQQIDEYRKARSLERIAWLRRLMASAAFEFEVVANPDGNLDELHHSLIQQYAVAPTIPVAQWAAQSIMVTHPLYIYSYIFADCLAAQLRYRLGREEGGIFNNHEVAPFLIEKCYSPGGYISWRDKVFNAVGHDVQVDELLSELKWNSDK
jgi:oligoendopeptidase F